MKRLLSIMLILSTFVQSTTFASTDNIKDIRFTHFSVNEGLSQGTVLSCCQDSLGHMWFATQDGLNRYDGYEFTVYRHADDDSTSISDNLIRKVFCSSTGKVWIGTENGLSVYEHVTDCFRNFPTDGKVVTGIAEADDGNTLMVAAGGGILLFDTATYEWSKAAPCQKESFGATTLHKDSDNVWIGTQKDGLFCHSIRTGEFQKIPQYTGRKPILCITRHKDALWIATGGDGLYRMDIRSRSVTNYTHSPDRQGGISSNYVRSLSPDMDGRLWIGTFNGLDILEDGHFTNIQGDPFIPGSLSQPSVRCVTQDNQGGMWLGTWFGGINYWHPLRNRFRSISRNASGNSLNDNMTSCIAEDTDGTLWIGTKNGGLNSYNSRSGKFRHYTLKKHTHDERIESNDIKAIHIDEEDGCIYFGAHAGGLNIIDKKRTGITNCRYGGKDDTPLDVYSIIPASDGKLWVGTLSGLKIYDKATRTFEDIDKDCCGNPLRPLNIKFLLKDSRDRLWIGCNNGIECMSMTDEGLLPYRPDILDELRLSAFVNGIYESSARIIWIATSDGLYSYNEQENKLTRYCTENGLPGNIIHGIEEDSFGRLWLSTENGLSRLNPFTGTFRNFSISDGIQSNQFNTYSHCLRRNGDMLFGGTNGITIFRPEKMEDNPYSPQPQITGLTIANKAVSHNDGNGILDMNILVTDGIRLRHDQNSFSVKITVPNYVAGHHNRFSYILEGFDKEWAETSHRIISYSNLPHGKYILKIMAANNDGKWNDTPRTLAIHIRPIWYKTMLAKITFILLLVILITAAYLIIVKRKEKENRIELEKQEKSHQEEIHQMKMRFFINISHEMRTPLTLIINPLQEMIAKSSDTWMRKQLKYVERNAKRLMHLVNQLMDYRRAELGVFKLKVRPENVHKIIKENYAYYEKLAQSKNIRYSLLSDLEGKTLNIDGQYLELILNNLLSNAFKYTDHGSITVRATQHADEFVLEICDTGKGIPSLQQNRIFERFYQIDNEHIGSGIGLSLVQRLVELHHGQITLDSVEGKGTTFTITIPLSPETYTTDETGDISEETHTSNSIEYYMLDTERQADDESTTTEGKRGRLLIADDNEEIRTYMKNGLSPMYDIMLAGNGEEALKMAKEGAPDIIISDMMMPVMDGIRLCTHLKQDLSTSHIPVIMVSAKTDKEDELNALKSGVDDFITKPFSMTILKAKIGNILRTQYRLQNKVSKSMEINPEKISFNAMDEAFLQKAIGIVERNMDNSEFSTEEFASEMHMSRSNLHIRLKALTGESALDFIRRIRFKEACRLLKDGRFSVSEISDMVGFNTPSYFATCFKKYMGCLPTEYVKNLK